MWENALYVGGGDDGVIEAPDLTVGAAVCWEFMRSGTARRLRGSVDLVMGGSNWWSIPQWPPTAYTRRAEAANAATAARAPSVFGRYVGAPVAHAAITGAFSCPLPELSAVNYHGRFEGGAQIADAHGTVLARREGSEGSGYVIADVERYARSRVSRYPTGSGCTAAARWGPLRGTPSACWAVAGMPDTCGVARRLCSTLHRSAPDAEATHSPAPVVREVCKGLVQSLCDASGRPRRRPR